MPRLGLRLTPHGRLDIEASDDAPEIDAAAASRLTDTFARGTGYGLLQLGAAEVAQALPPVFVWWRGFAAQHIGSLGLHASNAEADEKRPPPDVPPPAAAELASLVLTAPMMAGAEYLTQDVLLAFGSVAISVLIIAPTAACVRGAVQRRHGHTFSASRF